MFWRPNGRLLEIRQSSEVERDKQVWPFLSAGPRPRRLSAAGGETLFPGHPPGRLAQEVRGQAIHTFNAWVMAFSHRTVETVLILEG